MLLKPDCIPCILNMSLHYLHKLSLGEEQVHKIYEDILTLKPLRGEKWNITSPEVIEPIMEKIMSAVGSIDPFAAEKEKQNQKMLTLYPELQAMVKTAEHPLRTAAHLASLGNAIDIMLVGGDADIQKIIKEQLASPPPENGFQILEKRITNSSRILYFGDNAGEIVLDRLFIETIKKQHDTDITFVVRSLPTLNDATLKDSEQISMANLVPVIENGMDGPVPGTLLDRCSREVNNLFQEADLIISKGGGNFDTLDELPEKHKNRISYLLLSKCRPYQEHFGVGLHQPILCHG
ncbi:MAG: ARMT1-like domain-containing protein [Desulfobacterales bacterium]|nr:ARMT1-like domain-containing protein [Desulfobacterales bacterium]MDX2513412.1 ARMT1-like domain-containing protein [Desulfobacterales bacterium]